MSLQTDDLYFSYGNHEVLRGISFFADPGEFLSILGPNGVGKSTLFRCILGLLTPTKGRTLIDGRETTEMNPSELAKRIAYIPQSHSPVFNYSVRDMILMGTTSQIGRFSSPGQEQLRQAEKAMERLGIQKLANSGYQSISGGERQMVLIARALAQEAHILIMDEPSASLDLGNRIRVMQTMKSLAREGYTVIQSTHDPDQAYFYSDRIIALHKGMILASGDPGNVLCNTVISELYGTEVEVYSLREDRIRVCLPAE